jgi:hypothetical protein
MKANRRALPRTFRHVAFGSCVALAALLGACVAPAPAPAPPPAPLPRSVPQPRVPVVPTDWHDMPATPGVWQWRREGGLSIARFGDSPQGTRFSLTCNPSAGIISLSRREATGTPSTMAILTTSLSRKLAIRAGGAGAVTVPLPARDPLLDAMAYSRGRFAVEVPGLAPLYLPSWPEVSRVIEDCR